MRFFSLIITLIQGVLDLPYHKFQTEYLKLRETSNSENIGSILDTLSSTLDSFDQEMRDHLFKKLRDKLTGHSTKLSFCIMDIDRELTKHKAYEQRSNLLRERYQFVRLTITSLTIEDMQTKTLEFIKTVAEITKTHLTLRLPDLLKEFAALNARSRNLGKQAPCMQRLRSNLHQFVYIIGISKEMDQESGMDFCKTIREQMLRCCADMFIAEFNGFHLECKAEEMLLIFRIKTWLIFDLMHHIISTFKKIDDANSSTFLAETRNYIVENCWQKTSFLLYSQPLDDLMQQAPTLENLTTIAYQLFLEKVHPISS